MNKLVDEGFSNDAAAWMTTNLVENEVCRSFFLLNPCDAHDDSFPSADSV